MGEQLKGSTLFVLGEASISAVLAQQYSPLLTCAEGGSRARNEPGRLVALGAGAAGRACGRPRLEAAARRPYGLSIAGAAPSQRCRWNVTFTYRR